MRRTSARPAPGAVIPALMLAAALGMLGGGCRRGARSPEQAYARFAEAITSRDGNKLYAALDLETRWSWMTIRRAHREAYDIILSNFPEGAEREQRSRRFEAAALADSEAALFASQITPGRWEELGAAIRGLPAAPTLTPAGPDLVTTPAQSGEPLRFRKGEDGSWGFAGLGADAEDRKRRASADLELTRANAADFERAAARSGK